jgi:hypothetical protein
MTYGRSGVLNGARGESRGARRSPSGASALASVAA